MQVSLQVNGERLTVDVAAGETLLRVLRRQGYWSLKYGCDTGDCGACTILADGEPVLSCLVPAVRAAAMRLTTVEALGHPDALHPLQRAFLEHGAAQCGYCTPAMLLVAQALLQRDPTPTQAEVCRALASVLCRCTGYVKPLEAILACARRTGSAQADAGATGAEEPRRGGGDGHGA